MTSNGIKMSFIKLTFFVSSAQSIMITMKMKDTSHLQTKDIFTTIFIKPSKMKVCKARPYCPISRSGGQTCTHISSSELIDASNF